MEHKVTGCLDCPMYYFEDELGASYCQHPSQGEDNTIERPFDGNVTLPLTPTWCPLKKEPITIKLEQ